MAPHRNRVEARSSRKPARQFVSETHDHKRDAPIRTTVLLLDQIKRMTDQIATLPDRSRRKAVLLDRLQTLRIKQLRAEQRASRKHPASDRKDCLALVEIIAAYAGDHPAQSSTEPSAEAVESAQ